MCVKSDIQHFHSYTVHACCLMNDYFVRLPAFAVMKASKVVEVQHSSKYVRKCCIV